MIKTLFVYIILLRSFQVYIHIYIYKQRTKNLIFLNKKTKTKQTPLKTGIILGRKFLSNLPAN